MASVLMQSGFFNMDYAIRQLGFNLKPKSVIHDSNQNEIWIKDLPYILRAYKRFFRDFIKQVYGVDFKYDLELLRTFRDHTVVKMDFNTGIMEFEEGPESDILYYEKYLTNFWNMELIEEGTKKEASDDLIRDFCNMIDWGKKPHLFCMDPMVRRTCPMVSGRKWKFNHDWANDEICKKMDNMSLDAVSMTDIFVKDHSLKLDLNEGLVD